jgi:hypothetical protein
MLRSIHFAIHEFSDLTCPDLIDEVIICDVIGTTTSEVTLIPLSLPQLSHHGPRNPLAEVLTDDKQQIHLWSSCKSY